MAFKVYEDAKKETDIFLKLVSCSTGIKVVVVEESK